MENLNEMGLVELGTQATKETDGGYINSSYVTNYEGMPVSAEEFWNGVQWGLSAISALCTFDPRC